MGRHVVIIAHFLLTGVIGTVSTSGVLDLRNQIPSLFQIEKWISPVRYAADRLNTDVKFTDAALKMLVKVPRPFLKLVLNGCVDWANKNGKKIIDEPEMKEINDKRSQEKKNKK